MAATYAPSTTGHWFPQGQQQQEQEQREQQHLQQQQQQQQQEREPHEGRLNVSAQVRPSAPVRIAPFSATARTATATTNATNATTNLHRSRSNNHSAVENLSQSLGTYPHANFYRRQSTNVSKISYAGCLYKRSNHPVMYPSLPNQREREQDYSANIYKGSYPFKNTTPSAPTPTWKANTTTDTWTAQHDSPPHLPREPQHIALTTTTTTPKTETSTIRDAVQLQHHHATDEIWIGVEQDWQDSPAWLFACRLLDLPDTACLFKSWPAPSTATPTFHLTPQPYRRTNPTDESTAATYNLSPPIPPLYATKNHNQPQLFTTTSSSIPIPVPLKSSYQTSKRTTSPRRVHSESEQDTIKNTTLSDAPIEDHWKPLDDILAPDGHVWRARYCVLEDGVLYFYRHAGDAESPAAVAERQEDRGTLAIPNTSTNNTNSTTSTTSAVSTTADGSVLSSSFRPNISANLLAQSPRVPRARTHIWEKRVPVSCVRAVRSAENTYGPCALELSALEDAANAQDRLILRARNSAEMSEWMFQLHRAIEVWVRNIMTQSSSAQPISTLGGGGRPHANVLLSPRWTARDEEADALPQPTHGDISRRFHQHHHPDDRHDDDDDDEAEVAHLSHGHGRNSLHRRRIQSSPDDEAHHHNNHSPSLPFMPTTPGGHSPLFLSGAGASTTMATRANWITPHNLPPRPSTPPTPAMFALDEDDTPELSAPPPPEVQHPVPTKTYVPPHVRRAQLQQQNQQQQQQQSVALHTATTANTTTTTTIPLPPTTKKYVPPHLRKKGVATMNVSNVPGSPVQAPAPIPSTSVLGLSLAERLAKEEAGNADAPATTNPSRQAPGLTIQPHFYHQDIPIVSPPALTPSIHLVRKLGGCADPDDVQGSILEDRFIPRKASRLTRTRPRPYGATGGSAAAHWEIGAVSECGARNSNEDSYLIVGDLWQAFAESAKTSGISRIDGIAATTSLEDLGLIQTPGLFCVFDGHCGDHSARFAAERFTQYLYEASALAAAEAKYRDAPPLHVEHLIRESLQKMDYDFCQLCVQDGRAWESGATALIVALIEDDLVIMNLGDARGVASRSVNDDIEMLQCCQENGWSMLPEDSAVSDENEVDTSTGNGRKRCVWKDVTATHNPSREDERQRIEAANGWITTEKEIPVSQAHRLDLQDELARDILNRCFDGDDRAAAPHRLIQISRVCGELAVSRALGDRDFKAAFNPHSQDDESYWEFAAFLPYPEDHSHYFKGDLVSNVPEVQTIRIGQPGVYDEFLLLACDGLWDVMDADDAVRVTRKLLLEEGWPVKQAAARLAKLAVHLGSSDNVTVVIVRFLDRVN